MSLEKERIEKEHIEETNQAKLRFFTNVSHEFRTPLTLIISQVELMLQKNTIPPSLHNSIFRIRKHAQQMKLLISELLDFRKFDQNYIQLKLSEQSLNTFFFLCLCLSEVHFLPSETVGAGYIYLDR